MNGCCSLLPALAWVSPHSTLACPIFLIFFIVGLPQLVWTMERSSSARLALP
eukprot:COSAG05_NODE_754_length_7519_cov_4.955256_8_plen_52_part_00